MSKLTEIRKALEAATDIRESPWNIGAQSPNGCINVGSRGAMVAQCLELSPAELIAHAPEYITYLLQLVETQAKALEETKSSNTVLKDALEAIWSNSDDEGAIACAADALDVIKLIGRLKAGDKVRQRLTQLEGELVDIQYEHNRYQLKGISGWIYGISDLAFVKY